MRPLFGILASLALYAFSTVPADAEDKVPLNTPKDKTQRFCLDEDLLGHAFVMVDFKETPPRREASWIRAIPFHYLKFMENNKYSSVGTNRKIDSVQKAEGYLKSANIQNNTYRRTDDGILDLILNDHILYHYRCIAILKPKDEHFQKGDLILRGYTKKGKSELYKQYRIME
jgi:hypothetical protein